MGLDCLLFLRDKGDSADDGPEIAIIRREFIIKLTDAIKLCLNIEKHENMPMKEHVWLWRNALLVLKDALHYTGEEV